MDRPLHHVATERDHGDFAGAGLLGDLDSSLDGVPVEVRHVELEPRLIHGLAGGGDFEADVHVWDALEADCDLHRNPVVEASRNLIDVRLETGDLRGPTLTSQVSRLKSH